MFRGAYTEKSRYFAEVCAPEYSGESALRASKTTRRMDFSPKPLYQLRRYRRQFLNRSRPLGSRLSYPSPSTDTNRRVFPHAYRNLECCQLTSVAVAAATPF